MKQARRHCLLLIMTIFGHDHSECCCVDKEEVQPSAPPFSTKLHQY
jgi:hypothetical protein